MNLLGIDVGTTSVKAAVFNKDGEMLLHNTYDYTLLTSGDFVEFPPQEYVRILKQAIRDAKEKYDIYALAIDTQCETMILADDDGEPLCDAIVWLDNRASKEAEEIKAHFGNKRVYDVTGQPEIAATWPACKLLWFKKNKPDIFSKIKKVFLLEDYLLYALTGEFVTEKTLQSSSIYFDITKDVWWDEMLGFIGIGKEKLPRLLDSGVCVGEYEGIKVVTSAMDQSAASIGAGVMQEGAVSEMTGTTMVIFVPCNEMPPYNPDSVIPCHYNFNGKYAQILWTQTAGMVLKWFKNNFCEQFSFKQLDEIAKDIPAGANGLTMLPHLSGSTMPYYNPDAKGTFHGVTLEHTRAHFVRSILEAIAAQLRENLEYLPFDVNELITMGGGAQSRLWCQIKADMTDKTLKTLANPETAVLGSAILAGVGAGVYKTAEDAMSIVKTDKEYTPGGENYDEVYNRFIELDKMMNRRG